MNANHGRIGLRRDLTGELLTGNQRTESADLAEHGSLLNGVGPYGAAFHAGSGGLEPGDANSQLI